MAHAPPSARSTPFRKRSTFSRRLGAGRPRQSRSCPDIPSALRSGGLDILAQRFLLGLVFPDPPFDDVADRYQADNPVVLDHRQVPEFARGHRFHDRGDGVGLLAADDLARHYRADRFVEYRRTAFAERAHDVPLRQDAFDTALAQHQHGADLPLRQSLDRGGKPGVWLDALNLMTLGIENCTYRHCRLPEPIAPRPGTILFPLSLQSTVQRRFRCRRIRQALTSSTFRGLCLAS